MKAVLALLLGLVAGNPYSALKMDLAWKEDITFDWEELDHAVAFKNWQDEYNKVYGDINEESYRFLQFLDNWKMINEHNIDALNPESVNFTLGINQFADLSVEEFQYYIHGHGESCLQATKPEPKYKQKKPKTKQVTANPDQIDWTNYNGKSYVTPVKNQGQCGSCWAFSTTGSLESRTAIAKQQTGSSITTLSEQQLVDCSSAQGNQGCNGGLMDNAFKYIEKEGGLCSESEYKYTGRDGTCKASTCGTKYDPISTYTDVKSDNEGDLETAVAEGPVSVAVDAAGTTWQFYKSGVVDGHCGQLLDHGVLAVGYDNTAKEKYWKVKNSWGASWGMDGYILLCKDCDKDAGAGECGIAKQPSFPVPK